MSTKGCLWVPLMELQFGTITIGVFWRHNNFPWKTFVFCCTLCNLPTSYVMTWINASTFPWCFENTITSSLHLLLPFHSTVVHIPVHKRKDSLPTTRWREVNKVQQGQAILQQRRHSQNNDPVFLDTINISWMPIFNLFIYMPIYSLFVVICYSFMVYSFHKALLIYITGIAINQ